MTSYPVQERDGILWAWFGEPGRSRLHRVPELPWLADPAWATVGGESVAAAGYLLLHESFADVTQVPFVAPEIAPAVLGLEPPPLDVVVTETTVTLHREYPAAPLPAWQAGMLEADGTAEFSTSHDGIFLSPALWVDHWDVHGSGGETARMRFTHLESRLISPGHSRVLWRVSRDFAAHDVGAGATLTEMFEPYYQRVVAAMETAAGGARPRRVRTGDQRQRRRGSAEGARDRGFADRGGSSAHAPHESRGRRLTQPPARPPPDPQ